MAVYQVPKPDPKRTQKEKVQGSTCALAVSTRKWDLQIPLFSPPASPAPPPGAGLEKANFSTATSTNQSPPKKGQSPLVARGAQGGGKVCQNNTPSPEKEERVDQREKWIQDRTQQRPCQGLLCRQEVFFLSLTRTPGLQTGGLHINKRMNWARTGYGWKLIQRGTANIRS